MSAHTPGPWVYQQAENYVGFSIAPCGVLPTLAAVERPRGNPETISITAFNFPGSTEANARLIAAAPELLEALRELVEELDGTFPFAGMTAARAAIAKATVKQP